MVDRKKMTFIIGNTAATVTDKEYLAKMKHNQSWDWKIFVKSSDNNTSKYIKAVTFKLHETYRNPVRKVEKAPFELATRAYGYFNIEVKIAFHPKVRKEIITLDYMLDFSKNGTFQKEY